MNVLLRWWRFNVVGAMGMAVQLAALALLQPWVRGHYLYATAAAIECALLHNFIWHKNYTWRERSSHAAWVRVFLRFHLSSGVISIAGNLLLMRILVREAHLPVLAANAVAILCCSAANFCAAHRWTFAPKDGTAKQAGDGPEDPAVPERRSRVSPWPSRADSA